MTAQQAVKQLQYSGSMFDNLYIVHRYWRIGSTRCYIFLDCDWRIDSQTFTPGSFCEASLMLVQSYPFGILPFKMQYSDDWHIYTFAEVVKDSYGFPEGDYYQ